MIARRIFQPRTVSHQHPDEHTFISSKPKGGPAVLIVVVFLVLSIVGRFGVASVGLAFNLENNLAITPPLYRPDWVNLTFATSECSTCGTANGDNAACKKHRLHVIYS